MGPERLRLEWKSFLLRPQPDAGRSLEKFKRYTQSWERPAEEEPSAGFRVWASDEGPPSHSVPPHLLSKAAWRIDPVAWKSLHWSLLEAYFQHNRDITSEPTLRALWGEAGFPAERFEEPFHTALGEEIAAEIVADHREAIEHGAGGVPAVRQAGGVGVVMGAQPVAGYRRWIGRLEAAGR